MPLVVGWIFLCPLTLMGLRFARQVTLSGSMWDGLQALGARHLFTWRFFHLWFLADLLLFYVLALTVRWLIGQLALERRERLSETCRTLLRSSWHSAIFAIPTAALLLPIHLDRADLTTGLLLQVLLFMLFGFGVVLYAQRDFLGTWSRNAWRQVILAVALLPFAFWGARRTLLSEPQWDVTARLVGASTAALMLWLLLSGLMGLFIRYLDRPNQIYRYLSDASYSLYLLHLPMVVWVGGLVAGTALPAGIKYLLTLVVSIPALLLIYHYAIRSSGLAAVLGVSNKNPEAALRLADRTYDSA